MSSLLSKTHSHSLSFEVERGTNSGQMWQKFLQFQLGSKDIGLLPATMVLEVISIQAMDVLPVPEMPIWTLGVYSWRSEMLWLVELE